MLTKVDDHNILFDFEFGGALPAGRVLIARGPNGIYLNAWNKQAVRGAANVLEACDNNMIPLDDQTRKTLEIEAVVEALMPQANWVPPWEELSVMDSTGMYTDPKTLIELANSGI